MISGATIRHGPTEHEKKNATRHNITSCRVNNNYEGWNFNSGNYLFTTDTK